MLIEGGVITAVGPDVRAPAGAEVVDAGGRPAIPGLWDAHVHASQWVRTARMVPLGHAQRAEDVLTAIVAALG